MIIYKNCKIYLASDKSKRTVALIDVESETPLFDNLSWSGGDALAVDTSKTITTMCEFDYMSDNYNIVFPDGTDLKISGASYVQENTAMWKPRKRYKLTLTG